MDSSSDDDDDDSSSNPSSSSDHGSGVEEVKENTDDDDDEEMEVEESSDGGNPGLRRRRSAWLRGNDDDDDDEEEDAPMDIYDFLGADDDDDDDEDDDDDDSEEDRVIAGMMMGRAGQNRGPTGSSQTTVYCPSMRHGGCINTATWLDCGWQLSTGMTNEERIHGVASDECPTQLVTSGDDHLIKVFDVSHAMGVGSPIAGGRNTICPFSSPKMKNPYDLEEEWTTMYNERQQSSSSIRSSSGKNNKNCSQSSHPTNDYHLPGSVRLLTTLHTGHRGNVFHVTPVRGKPGVVATCGADGFLRLTDMEHGESSIVISPDHDDELSGLLPMGLLSMRRIMCFSHHFINQNVGLLCSERGLRKFDIRLSPREQSTQSLLSGPFRGCKACAILSGPSSADGESTYAFGKFDLRCFDLS